MSVMFPAKNCTKTNRRMLPPFSFTYPVGGSIKDIEERLTAGTMAKRTSKSPSSRKKKNGKKPEMSASLPSKKAASTVVTPDDETNASLSVVTPTQRSTTRGEKEPQTNARRRLFAAASTENSISALVSPSPKDRKRKVAAEDSAPAAKRRLMFGRLVDIKECQQNVANVYKIVRKLTGSIGGNGYSGPIYGELTMGSMQKMIDLMMEQTGFDSSSRFIDVGSGIGKPNLHVAQYPGVKFSCGVEMEHTRWSLGMTCLKAVLDQAVQDERDGVEQVAEEKIQGNCVFLHSNILEAKSFDPFTHVYMFSIGKTVCVYKARGPFSRTM